MSDQGCMLDRVFGLCESEESLEEFLYALFERLRKSYVIESEPCDEPVVKPNIREWNFLQSTFRTATEHYSKKPDYHYVLVAIYLWMHRNEVYLQDITREELKERREFYEESWLPHLERETVHLLERFSPPTVVQAFQEFALEMASSWLGQYCEELPEEDVEDAVIGVEDMDPDQLLELGKD